MFLTLFEASFTALRVASSQLFVELERISITFNTAMILSLKNYAFQVTIIQNQYSEN